MSACKAKVLLADDDAAAPGQLGQWLASAGYVTRHVSNGREAVAAIRAECPQILLCAWDLPGVNGLRLTRWLRRQHLPHHVYSVFMSGHADPAQAAAALRAGADGFVAKPLDREEMLARVKCGVRTLDRENRLSSLAQTDPLTGLPTRRTFFELLEREWSRSQRHHVPLSCVMLDVDFFKRVNDTYGHRVGDKALESIADILREECRRSDIVARYGGEEFCVLLPDATEENACVWAERVRDAIALRAARRLDPAMRITASFGVAQRRADTESPEQFFDLADQALLVAKRSGRNRVVRFAELRVNSSIESQCRSPDGIFQGLSARHVMTSVATCLAQTDSVGHAARFFLDFRFQSAPVVDNDGGLVGLLSERDVMNIMLWPNWWTTRIKDVMKRDVVCYEEDARAWSIYEFLSRVSLRGVVIVRDGRPTGMISRTSLLRWFTNSLDRENGRQDATDDSCDANASQAASEASVIDITRAVVEEARRLELCLGEPAEEFVPSVIGGVSRLEELLKDLLVASRHTRDATRPPAIATWPDSEPGNGTVTGVAELIDAMSAPRRLP